MPINTTNASDINSFTQIVTPLFNIIGSNKAENIRLEKGWRELHHRQPRYYGGKDVPENLILLNKTVHLMVHAETEYKFYQFLKGFPLTDRQFKMVNQLRYEAHRPLIKIAC